MSIIFKILVMAVIYTAILEGYQYGFDFADQRIDVDVTLSSVKVVNLWTAIKEAQAWSGGIVYSNIATAEGLTTLSTGISTFLTVELLENWEVNTLQSSGKFEVKGGNLVRADEADPFRDNPLITYINNLSQAGVVATPPGGVDLSPETEAQIDEIYLKTRRINEKHP